MRRKRSMKVTFQDRACSSRNHIRGGGAKRPISPWQLRGNSKWENDGRNTDCVALSTERSRTDWWRQRWMNVTGGVQRRKLDARKILNNTFISRWDTCTSLWFHFVSVSSHWFLENSLSLFGLSAFRILFHRFTSSRLRMNVKDKIKETSLSLVSPEMNQPQWFP